ncbi:hypothetical protein AQ490_19320 [Wenjunlia vitaminophila]|uniref:CN hydrolase domain-containing protein n=1 Tax=Wenjunlia vitaminophila TaxID=76728 RepID=A0A0T6LUQ2_WENVI|nr:carbon-nitrogen hydrolase family protein [Wenjunlia vitaminophila]KRV49837.1 hypothetical protein AQ490_19320 [Wenjunlia vitaminophila]
MGLRIALGQAASVPGDLTTNVATAVRLVTEAARAGARLLALPELFACGYDPAAIAAGRPGYVLDAPAADGRWPAGSVLAPLAEAADRHGMWVLLGAALVTADDPVGGEPGGTDHLPDRRGTPARPQNAVLVFDPTGRIRGRYAKAHLWGPERTAFTPGAELVMVEDGGVSVGIGICYDAGFPELTRAYARAGAHAVLFSSAFAEGPTAYRYHVYHPARAVENTVYTLAVNAVGDLAGDHYFGCSSAWHPDGRPLVTHPGGTGVVVADIVPEEVDRVRGALRYLAELRTDMFAPGPPAPLTRIRTTAVTMTGAAQ